MGFDYRFLEPHPSLDDVLVDPRTKRMYRFDGEHYKRTYYSEEKKRRRLLIPVDTLLIPTDDDHRLARLLYLTLLDRGMDPKDGVERKVLTDILATHRKSRKRNLVVLLRLWRCGLVERTGRYFARSKRYYDQKWFVL
jgi:hypothetical protein